MKTRKAPEGNSESPWSLHIRSFWKIHFINPPEVQGQIVSFLFYWWENDNPKVPKSPIRVNKEIAGYVP